MNISILTFDVIFNRSSKGIIELLLFHDKLMLHFAKLSDWISKALFYHEFVIKFSFIIQDIEHFRFYLSNWADQ